MSSGQCLKQPFSSNLNSIKGELCKSLAEFDRPAFCGDTSATKEVCSFSRKDRPCHVPNLRVRYNRESRNGPGFQSLMPLEGRANLKAVEDQPDTTSLGFKRSGSLLDALPQSEAELEAIRRAVVQREGLLPMLFELLRRMPRRVLMILKLNDLTR